jgi:hypothetical protein
MARRAPLDIPKLDDEDPSPRTVLRNLEQLDNADKAAALGKRGSHISERDLEDLCDYDLAWRERIPASDFHVWSLPKANGGRDLAVTNAIAEGAKELHVVRPRTVRAWSGIYDEG